MKKLAKYLVLVTALVALAASCVLLTGCEDKEPKTEAQVLKELRAEAGSAWEYLGSEELPDEDNIEGHEGYDCVDRTLYKFRSEYGFDFELESGRQYSNGLEGIGSGYYQYLNFAPYFDGLWDNFLAEGAEYLASKHGLKASANEKSYAVIVDLSAYDQVEDEINFVLDYRRLLDKLEIASDRLDDYLVGTSKDGTLICSNAILSYKIGDKPKSIIGRSMSMDEMNSKVADAHVKLVQYCYRAAVLNGSITDDDLTQSGSDSGSGSDSESALRVLRTQTPPQEVNKLYVNGKLFKSEMYPDYYFSWSPVINDYLAVVAYGIDLDYNNSPRDHMQREIITDYLGGTYDIDPKREVSTYTVGGHDYEASIRGDFGEKTSCTIKRDGRRLDVSLYTGPLYWRSHTGATYFHYMPASDWADLMGCTIKLDGDALYLTSK